MIELLLKQYKRKFPFSRFYDNLLYNISAYPKHHTASATFLSGYVSKTKVTDDIPLILTKAGDIRVDLPIWFGDSSAKTKIIVVGLEPRDTDKSGHLNIERIDNYVFGTPFALERPKGPYHTAFQELINASNAFLYFTDVVKTYQVESSGDKAADDRIARKSFWGKAQKGKAFFLEELQTIAPTKIIALGNDSFSILNKHLGETFDIQKVRHPSQGCAKLAREQLKVILQSAT
jgi:hypothetical protein